jgi:hypothetical protein
MTGSEEWIDQLIASPSTSQIADSSPTVGSDSIDLSSGSTEGAPLRARAWYGPCGVTVQLALPVAVPYPHPTPLLRIDGDVGNCSRNSMFHQARTCKGHYLQFCGWKLALLQNAFERNCSPGADRLRELSSALQVAIDDVADWFGIEREYRSLLGSCSCFNNNSRPGPVCNGEVMKDKIGKEASAHQDSVAHD